MEEEEWDLVVVGAGPAGLIAGIYARGASLSTMILERAIPGGLLLGAAEVENYPGFPDPVPCPGWMSALTIQTRTESARLSSGDEM